jgi:hypothetical protein
LAAEHPFKFEPAAPTFGTFRRMDAPERELTIVAKNMKARPVLVDAVAIGCGCMHAEIESARSVEPGGDIRIRVVLSRSAIHVGAATFPLTLLSKGAPVDSVPVSYNFIPLVRALTPEVRLTSDSSFRAITTLACTSHAVAASLTARSGSPFVTVALRLRDPAGSDVELEIQADPKNTPFGKSVAQVSLFVNGLGEPEAIIGVTCEKPFPASASPAILLLGSIQSTSKVVTRQINISGVDREPTLVKASLPAIRIEQILPSALGCRAFQVTVPLDQLSASLINERITFFYAGSDEFSVEVPIVGEVVRP